MMEEIKKILRDSAEDRQKMAMFHLQVLMNAPELEGLSPEAFCRDVEVPDSYKAEFRKMINLRRLLDERGISLVEGPVRPGGGGG